MRIFFVNRFYWPEEPATAQLLSDLATHLARTGWEVGVITSRPDSSASRHEWHEAVAIHRVRSTRWGKTSLPGRVLDFLTFHLAALWKALRLLSRGDVLVALTDPPLIGVPLSLAAGLRGARLIHWVQDIYPEIAVELTGHRWLLALRPLRNLAWRRAEACVAPGTDMTRALARAKVPPARIVVSENWAPEGVAPTTGDRVRALRESWGLQGKFVVGYSGNLGRVHGLDAVLELAAALRGEPDFLFQFIGDGPRRVSLQRDAAARGLTNLRFLPAQPRAQLSSTLAVPDVHLVTLLPGAEACVFPSKLYGIAAVGRPVLFLGPPGCELARLVVGRRMGAAFTRAEAVEAAAWVRGLQSDADGRQAMGAAARAFAAHGLDRAASRWQELLRGTLAAR